MTPPGERDPVAAGQDGIQKPSGSQTPGAETLQNPPPKSDNGTSSAEPEDQNKPPIEKADDLKTKVTVATYVVSGDLIYDINIRHQFGKVAAWAAGFIDPNGDSQARAGLEYDFHHDWIPIKPSAEIGTSGGMIGYLYSELGNKPFGIIGLSRTKNRPLQDIYFDPNDSAELGVGHKFSDYDRLTLSTVFDVRFHTGQQNTHLVWRHKINDKNGITIDALFKSGHTEFGTYIRAFRLGV